MLRTCRSRRGKSNCQGRFRQRGIDLDKGMLIVELEAVMQGKLAATG